MVQPRGSHRAEGKTCWPSEQGPLDAATNGVKYGCTGTAVSGPSDFGYDGHKQWEVWECLSSLGDSAPVGLEACSHRGGLGSLALAQLCLPRSSSPVVVLLAERVDGAAEGEGSAGCHLAGAHLRELLHRSKHTPCHRWASGNSVAVVGVPDVAQHWSVHGICRKAARTMQAQEHSHTVVVLRPRQGLPPDMELTQVAEQLCGEYLLRLPLC